MVLLLILALLAVVSMGFARSGTAPFTVVYGPASAFRAERAILLLTAAIFAALRMGVIFAQNFSLASRFQSTVAAILAPAADPALSGCSLRC